MSIIKTPKRRGRRPREDSPTLYFSEETFKNIILPKVQNNEEIPDTFVSDIFAITDGMINTEFRNNEWVIENREDLKHECFYEVLKSIKKFDKDRGRSFAYFNRIIKNTLLKWYYRNLKVQSQEVKIVDLTKEYEGGDSFNIDDALSLLTNKIINENENTEQNTELFSTPFDIDFSKPNKIIKRKQDHSYIDYAVHKYITNLIFRINTILGSEELMYSFSEYIKYNRDNDALENMEDMDIESLLLEAKCIFESCINTINKKISVCPEKYAFDNTSSILLTSKVLIYIKNEISDKMVRKKCTKIIKNPTVAANIIILLVKFLSSQ